MEVDAVDTHLRQQIDKFNWGARGANWLAKRITTDIPDCP
jgi:hypothetical protein